MSAGPPTLNLSAAAAEFVCVEWGSLKKLQLSLITLEAEAAIAMVFSCVVLSSTVVEVVSSTHRNEPSAV